MTTVLQKLSLNAYRGVSGLVLENLTPVSLVVGANNSGKSSILEAFSRAQNGPEAIGVVLDSDDEPAEQRFAKLKTSLEAAKLSVPSSLGAVSSGNPRVGVFALPAGGSGASTGIYLGPGGGGLRGTF